jgi:hypothetical protein
MVVFFCFLGEEGKNKVGPKKLQCVLEHIVRPGLAIDNFWRLGRTICDKMLVWWSVLLSSLLRFASIVSCERGAIFFGLVTGDPKVKGSWGRRLLAVAGEVTRHGRAHPYSWSITIVSLGSKESEESHRSKWKTKLLSMFLTVTCQHASGACQSHSCPVLNLREASRKYVGLSPSTPPFLTLQFYEKDLTPTPNILQISGQYSLRSGIFDTSFARAYLFTTC